MNKFRIIILGVLFSLIAVAQPKKANTITVTNHLTQEENFKSVGGILLNNGFAFDLVDDTFYTLKTMPKRDDKSAATCVLNIVCKDSTVVFYGQYRIGDVYPNYSQIDYRGQKGSPAKEAWNTLNNAAKLVDGSIVYSITD